MPGLVPGIFFGCRHQKDRRDTPGDNDDGEERARRR